MPKHLMGYAQSIDSCITKTNQFQVHAIGQVTYSTIPYLWEEKWAIVKILSK